MSVEKKPGNQRVGVPRGQTAGQTVVPESDTRLSHCHNHCYLLQLGRGDVTLFKNVNRVKRTSIYILLHVRSGRYLVTVILNCDSWIVCRFIF